MKKTLWFLGLDVHAKSITLALAEGGGGEARIWHPPQRSARAGEGVYAFMRVSPYLGAESSEASGVLADRSFVMDAGLLRHAHTSELPLPTVSVILHLCTV